MVKTNTEKPMTIAERKQTQIKDVEQSESIKPIVTPKKQKVLKTPVQKNKIIESKDSKNKIIDKSKQPNSDSVIDKTSQLSDSKQTKFSTKEEEKKPVQKKPVVKKTEAVVNAQSLPISIKYAVAICKFIKKKKIGKAIADLEQVLVLKNAVPMKGEIPHRRGKIMSGRYPKKATEYFIKVLKSLQANAVANELEQPVIVKAMANLASRPYGRFGSVKRKRTHLKIIAKNKKLIENKGGKKK